MKFFTRLCKRVCFVFISIAFIVVYMYQGVSYIEKIGGSAGTLPNFFRFFPKILEKKFGRDQITSTRRSSYGRLRFSSCPNFVENWCLPDFWVADHEYKVRNFFSFCQTDKLFNIRNTLMYILKQLGILYTLDICLYVPNFIGSF